MIDSNNILSKRFNNLLSDRDGARKESTYETKEEKHERIKRKLGLTHGKGKRKKRKK